ncbi:hypothetical protein SAMCCGM7_pA0104 (plasmid) [Sinorhizobium americanum CCGM7]|nr:hypothetical protein SAMCCGM7_pA0104 [Sinorhizobium americanum CCGM7]
MSPYILYSATIASIAANAAEASTLTLIIGPHSWRGSGA